MTLNHGPLTNFGMRFLVMCNISCLTSICVYSLVVPGSKRDNVELGKAEKEAGQAVLKLLDAKIGG